LNDGIALSTRIIDRKTATEPISSVTSLGEISLFGRYFWLMGAFI
jgi:hypothetical protein